MTPSALRRSYVRRGKRVLDLLVTIPLLVVLAPVMLLIALAIRQWMGAPVLFRQIRPGYDARLFAILKFRTMTNATNREGEPLSDAQRLTPLGKLLRRTRLDELPQLLNIARGEMSLVGPRPLLPEYLEHYTPRQARRHEVLPGVTGWAQIHGGNQMSWEQKFEYDVWYVEHVSLWLDLTILWRTFVLLVRSLVRPQADEAAGRFEGRPFSSDQ